MFIFISHSSKDERRVEDIINLLKRLEVDYFAYETHIQAGKPIREEVLNAIKKTTHMLVIVSSVTKDSSWIWYEVGVAFGINLAQFNEIVVIPYKLDSNADLPDFVHGLRYISSHTELEDFINKSRESSLAVSKGKEITSEDRLRFGGFEASIKMIDFCPQGYLPENFKIRYVPRKSARKPPARLQKEFERKRDIWRKKEKNKEIFDNKDLIGLADYKLLRVSEQEVPGIELDVFKGSYVDHRAAVAVFHSLPSEQQREVISEAIHTKPMHGGHRFFGTIIAVSIALITADNKLVFVRRSHNVSIDPGLIMCGIGESMKSGDLEAQNVPYSGLYYTSIRGLKEEYGIFVPDPLGGLKLTGLCLNRDLFEWYVLGVFDLRKCGANWDEAAIQSNNAIAANKDKFEMGDLFFVEFSPDKVFAFLSEHGSEMVNYGTAVAICSLLADDKNTVEHLRASAKQFA